MDHTSQKFIEAARKIFKSCFKGCADPEDIGKAVYLAAEDPGEWAPKSILVVHTEGGIPDRFYYPSWEKCWDKAEKKLSALLGKEAYFESINGAVTALYWV